MLLLPSCTLAIVLTMPGCCSMVPPFHSCCRRCQHRPSPKIYIQNDGSARDNHNHVQALWATLLKAARPSMSDALAAELLSAAAAMRRDQETLRNIAAMQQERAVLTHATAEHLQAGNGTEVPAVPRAVDRGMVASAAGEAMVTEGAAMEVALSPIQELEHAPALTPVALQQHRCGDTVQQQVAGAGLATGPALPHVVCASPEACEAAAATDAAAAPLPFSPLSLPAPGKRDGERSGEVTEIVRWPTPTSLKVQNRTKGRKGPPPGWQRRKCHPTIEDPDTANLSTIAPSAALAPVPSTATAACARFPDSSTQTLPNISPATATPGTPQLGGEASTAMLTTALPSFSCALLGAPRLSPGAAGLHSAAPHTAMAATETCVPPSPAASTFLQMQALAVRTGAQAAASLSPSPARLKPWKGLSKAQHVCRGQAAAAASQREPASAASHPHPSQGLPGAVTPAQQLPTAAQSVPTARHPGVPPANAPPPALVATAADHLLRDLDAISHPVEPTPSQAPGQGATCDLEHRKHSGSVLRRNTSADLPNGRMQPPPGSQVLGSVDLLLQHAVGSECGTPSQRLCTTLGTCIPDTPSASEGEIASQARSQPACLPLFSSRSGENIVADTVCVSARGAGKLGAQVEMQGRGACEPVGRAPWGGAVAAAPVFEGLLEGGAAQPGMDWMEWGSASSGCAVAEADSARWAEQRAAGKENVAIGIADVCCIAGAGHVAGISALSTAGKGVEHLEAPEVSTLGHRSGIRSSVPHETYVGPQGAPDIPSASQQLGAKAGRAAVGGTAASGEAGVCGADAASMRTGVTAGRQLDVARATIPLARAPATAGARRSRLSRIQA
jgi:hypothetical protein